jgi:LssY C-terminus
MLELLRRIFSIAFEPDESLRSFMDRAQSQSDRNAEVTAAVLDARESAKRFGVPLARRGIQPVFLRIANQSDRPLRLYLLAINPNYFTPLEAAAANHFSILRRLAGFGILGFFFWPLLAFFIPFKLVSAYRANRRMDAMFQAAAFRLKPISPGAAAEGFVFTPFDAGTKVVRVCLHSAGNSLSDAMAVSAAAKASAAATAAVAEDQSTSPDGAAASDTSNDDDIGVPTDQLVSDFTFTITVPGIKVDHVHRDFSEICPPDSLVECDVPALAERLNEMPATTTNHLGTRHGDPVNLVVIGEFETILTAFAPRWDESETITLETCWKTATAFLLGSQYRYSPVSPLYLFSRSQDVALQRIRHSINDRLHLRLWLSPLKFQNLPVWVGQISRDIGVRFTVRTWNLTTHRVNPDVDESRDYVVEDLLAAEHVQGVAYVEGVGECSEAEPRRNLCGDRYFTDGKRAVLLLSESRSKPRVVLWG